MGVSPTQARARAEQTLGRVEETLGRRMLALAWANLVANIVIVITGGAVRLTASGLGCPTWPRCTEESFTPHGELGVHGVIEFGNRMLTYVLVAVAVACWLAARNRRETDPRRVLYATIIALGIPAQAIIGGITVLTDLNPWVVALHMLVSMAMVGVCVLLLDHLVGEPRPAAPTGVRRLAWLVFGAGWLVLYLGTVVTGSGPHAGDADAPRNGLDPQVMSHVHAWAVYVLVALTIGAAITARRIRSPALRRAAAVLLVVEVVQGAIGFAQYFLDLPELLVGIHMLGAALTSAAITWLVLTANGRAETAAEAPVGATR